jgi:peptidoglycan/xylan/chitin deacetylase (PgdA/CDA1 family)
MSAVRAVLRDVVAGALFAAGVTAPGRSGNDRLTVVSFHRVLPPSQRAEYPLPGLAVTPSLFEWLLDWFSRHYVCDTLAGSLRRLEQRRDGEPPLLAITFDDGQADNYHHAAPALARARLRATFFVPVAAVARGELLWHDRLAYASRRAFELESEGASAALGSLAGSSPRGNPCQAAREAVARAKRMAPAERLQRIESIEALIGGAARPDWEGMMTFEQLAELAGAGHEIGSHSMTHALLPQCSDVELEQEIASSRRVLEDRLGIQVESFCYPNGDFDERAVDVVRLAGYRQAVTTAHGAYRSGVSPYTIPRFDLVEEHALDRAGRPSQARLAWRLSAWHPGPR